MAKKRKTRQEKIIADLRRQLQTQKPAPKPASTSSLYSLPQTKPIVQPTSFSNTSNLTPNTHSYVLSDLKKTLLFTIIALAGQVGLYIVLMR